MKVIVIKEAKEFEPIELKITIESAAELCSLWHRFHVSPANLGKVSDFNALAFNPIRHGEVFHALDELAKERGLER